MSESKHRTTLQGLWSRMRKKKKADRSKPRVKHRQASVLREKVETYTEAITFAEAGLHEDAQELMRAQQAEKAKVLVVGNGASFSTQVVDYATGFAKRMGYEIIALNVGPIGTSSSAKAKSYNRHLQDQFRQECEQGVERLRRSCEEKGIPFVHVVKFGEIEESIKEVHEDIRRVEFVITEPESCPGEGKVAIPVFCMAR